MNVLFLILCGIGIFAVGYIAYARFLEREVFGAEDRETPAHTERDDVDFVPARLPMLFGNHFASIAGAGPIIGPLVGLMCFGWAPAFLWIVLGTVLIGGVHDYLSLMVSVRSKGVSIASVAEEVVGKRARMIFSAFLWLALILVITVFGVVGAKTLVIKPEVVLPTVAIVPIAILMGWMVYRAEVPLFLSTVIGVSLLFISILIGLKLPLKMPSLFGLSPTMVWFIILMLYCLICSALPIWLLMQPRDYLCLAQLILCLAIGYLGIVVARPEMSAPALSSLSSAKGPIWPMLFILIACGAVSGFHSLVASGTSSKQLPKEADGRLIGYGGMCAEGILALLALIVAGAGLFWGAQYTAEQFGLQASLKKSWIFAFGQGYGRILNEAFPAISLSFAAVIGMTMLKTFVMTTLDDGTRLARFIITENLGKMDPLFRNRLFSSLICIIPAFILGSTNAWQEIWPVFGASNQLIAALTLIVITSYLIGKKKPARYTLIPAIFMLTTTICGLLWISFSPSGFFAKGEFLCGAISVVLIGLAGVITFDGIFAIRRMQ
jgi:carbon starvation protein